MHHTVDISECKKTSHTWAKRIRLKFQDNTHNYFYFIQLIMCYNEHEICILFLLYSIESVFSFIIFHPHVIAMFFFWCMNDALPVLCISYYKYVSNIALHFTAAAHRFIHYANIRSTCTVCLPSNVHATHIGNDSFMLVFVPWLNDFVVYTAHSFDALALSSAYIHTSFGRSLLCLFVHFQHTPHIVIVLIHIQTRLNCRSNRLLFTTAAAAALSNVFVCNFVCMSNHEHSNLNDLSNTLF